LALALICSMPGLASATHVRRTRPTAHKHIAHKRCATERSKESPSHEAARRARRARAAQSKQARHASASQKCPAGGRRSSHAPGKVPAKPGTTVLREPLSPPGALEAPTTTPTPGEALPAPRAEPEAPSSGNPISNAPAPLSAQGEDFAEQPAGVLLTYPETVTPSVATQCVVLEDSGNTETFGGIDQGPTAQTIRLELAPGGAMPAKVRCPAEAEVRPASTIKAGDTLGEVKASDTSGEADVLPVTPAAASPGGVVSDPIDPKYLTEVPFGTQSFWLQPWRAYLDTWPASRLAESLGINFNVTSREAQDTAQLLQNSAFKLARIEIPWDSLSYENPTQFANEPGIREHLEALHDHGLRPLILLNANSGGPTPAKYLSLETLSTAPSGATTVKLSAASAAEVVSGKTGFNNLSFGGAPDILITSVGKGNVAALSKPLPEALPAGAHNGTTLLYAPFGPSELSDGKPNPAFKATLAGWLSYVATVCKEAQSIFGPEGYDLEIWNELTFGSQFLNEENYYSPARETGTGSVTKALLEETVAYVRNPANGISPGVGITDGFASETPFPTGAFAPKGLTALSKHPYAGPRSFPSSYESGHGDLPLNALGEEDIIGPHSHFTPFFLPHYQSVLPEYFLTATQTETLIRDLAPFTTKIYEAPHGRAVGPPGESPTQDWMTEYNLEPAGEILGPDEVTPESSVELTPADKAHFQAKALLRSLVSVVSKGMTRAYFFAATHAGDLSMINESFMSAVDADPTAYPGNALGGETMTGFRNMLAQFQGPGPGGPPRQLQLLSIAQEGNHAQFNGNGTAAYPDLYDRDVLAVFPFQSSPTRYVIPVYVMSRDMLTLYNPSAPSTDITRFDLPDETFRVTLGGLPETSSPPTVSAYDPLRNEATPARFISRFGSEATFEFAATDYPRLLTIEYR